MVPSSLCFEEQKYLNLHVNSFCLIYVSHTQCYPSSLPYSTFLHLWKQVADNIQNYRWVLTSLRILPETTHVFICLLIKGRSLVWLASVVVRTTTWSTPRQTWRVWPTVPCEERSSTAGRSVQPLPGCMCRSHVGLRYVCVRVCARVLCVDETWGIHVGLAGLTWGKQNEIIL